eukprot:TRINITY_DN2084_c0_g1_i1.p1 TRINITY_DN2084_c0_g1~~TRINITY_DN2084_c0_g1_i1.p1  ORF type:complete len:248 (+),score=67.32 TRINITY_DN2084_c0_g1_i1:45-788(+)
MMLSPDVEARLAKNETMREIYEAVGTIQKDTLIATKHGWIDHIFGPQPITEVFSSKERYRPHNSRVVMENYEPFYVWQGMNRVIGTAWLTGIMVGGVQGFYEGLAARQTKSWRTAYQSLNSFSRTKGPLRANQFAAVAFTFCFYEAIARDMCIRNERLLEFGEHGYVLGKVGFKEPDMKYTWQTDSRWCAPVGAGFAALTLRLIKGGAGAKPGVLLSNAVLASLTGFMYSHLWSKEDYFDIEKKFIE